MSRYSGDEYRIEAIVKRVGQAIGLLWPQGKVDAEPEHSYYGWRFNVTTVHNGERICTSRIADQFVLAERDTNVVEYLINDLVRYHADALVHLALSAAKGSRYSTETRGLGEQARRNQGLF